MDLKQALLADLTKSLQHVVARKRANYTWMYTLLVLSLFATLAAVVVASLDQVASYVRGVVAAVSSLALLFGDSLQLNEKARWNHRKQAALEGLIGKLRYQNGDVALVSLEWTKLEERFSQEWPGLKVSATGGHVRAAQYASTEESSSTNEQAKAPPESTSS
jgi:hypothetical protein